MSGYPHSGPEMARLGEDHADEALDVLADAFSGYPVFRYVLGPDYHVLRLRRLLRFFVQARLLRREPILGVFGDGGLAAVALLSYPGILPSPPELADAREDVWRALGPDARARYERFGAVTGAFFRDGPRLHLNMIGVRAARRGAGHGRRLLDEVHRMAEEDARVAGVTLTTEAPGNVPLYRHFGYRILGHAPVAPGLESWGFFRSAGGPPGPAHPGEPRQLNDA